MGASHTTLSSAAVEEDATQPLSTEYAMDQRLFPGSGRMMRTFRLVNRQTGSSVVAKTVWISQDESIERQRAELQRIKEALKDQPHVAPFVDWKLGDVKLPQQLRPVALVRNYVYTTLSDRLESRPFLTNVEKLFIIHQLLIALQHMHDANVYHGFLTTENIGLTSWNYLVILDLSSYKARTALPDDDPSEYRYYFQEFHKHGTDTTQRESKCYLAPERFYSPKETAAPDPPLPLTAAMDVFSAGCIMLETSLSGERALDLGDMMDYRKQGSFPPSLQQKFQKIESSSLRAACRHMLHLDASQRLSPREYLERLNDIIPSTFEETLLPFVDKVTSGDQVKTPDARIALAAAHYGRIIYETIGVDEEDGQAYFAKFLGPRLLQMENLVEEQFDKENDPADNVFDADKILNDTEELLKKLEKLDFEDEPSFGGADHSNSPNATKQITQRDSQSSDSLLIFVQLVLCSLRHVYRPSSKLIGLELVRRLAIHSSDETRLQRIIPSITSLLQDQDPLVRASSLRIITETLSIVQSFPPSDSKIFPQYIFKRVAHLLSDPSLVVRVSFARCIAVLAETSQRFLDISHAVRLYEAVGGGGSSGGNENKSKSDPGVFDDKAAKLLDSPDKDDIEEASAQAGKGLTGIYNTLVANTYDAELAALQEVVSRWVVSITTDPSDQSSPPKRALVSDLARLCNFYGRDGVMSFILPQILTFLNDRRDWQLRASLFKDLPSACNIIGRAATEHFVLPCLETALVDGEDKVIESALACLVTLVDNGLLSRGQLVDTRKGGLMERKPRSSSAIFEKYCPLLLVPTRKVRAGAIGFVNACCRAFGSTDSEVFLVPILRPYIRFEPSDFHLTTSEGLEKCLVEAWTDSRWQNEMVRLTHELKSGKKNMVVDGGSQIQNTESDEQNESFNAYLKMMARNRMAKLASSSGSMPKLTTAIEGTLKLSQSVKFPSQPSASSMEKSIPDWFNQARKMAEDNADASSEFSSLQSVAALSQVYGLSIMRETDKGEATSETIATDDEGKLSEAELLCRLKGNDAKLMDAAISGQWGSDCVLDPALATTTSLVGKLRGLNVPTLSRRLGLVLENSPTREVLSKGMGDWRPKVEQLIATSCSSSGHNGPVARIAVSHDQRFFVSGSYDSTCKVWELGKVDTSCGIIQSSSTYAHDDSGFARVNDIVLLEGSHSAASAASDGSVHVWRVDLVTAKGGGHAASSASSVVSSKVSGSSWMKTVDSNEGEALAVSHYNALSASVLAYATQRGSIHTWDLRSEREPFRLQHPAEIGYLTSMALGTDRNWMVAGTNRGFVALWDIRSRSMVKLWHHSSEESITRLATSYTSIPGARTNIGLRPLMFLSTGNECGMFDITDGQCRQGFRVLGSDEAYGISPSRIELKALNEIDVSGANLSRRVRQLQIRDRPGVGSGPKMNAMVGSMGGYDQNYLITGGADAHIRYWDFSTPSKCFVVSGQNIGSQHRPAHERIDFPMAKLMVCRHSTGPRVNDVESSRLPRMLQRGQSRAESRHRDAILDLKLIQSPTKALISSSRDGTLKLFK